MIIPTTPRIKILIWSLFIGFHLGVILTGLGMTGMFNHNTIMYDLTGISILIMMVGIPFAYIGWKYIYIKSSGKGTWAWSKEDLERYNQENKN